MTLIIDTVKYLFTCVIPYVVDIQWWSIIIIIMLSIYSVAMYLLVLGSDIYILNRISVFLCCHTEERKELSFTLYDYYHCWKKCRLPSAPVLLLLARSLGLCPPIINRSQHT